jgi:hypothetical protein
MALRRQIEGLSGPGGHAGHPSHGTLLPRGFRLGVGSGDPFVINGLVLSWPHQSVDHVREGHPAPAH